MNDYENDVAVQRKNGMTMNAKTIFSLMCASAMLALGATAWVAEYARPYTSSQEGEFYPRPVVGVTSSTKVSCAPAGGFAAKICPK